MFYRAVIVKEKTNSKTITLRAKSKEDIEEMMPRIKSFLYPDEDTDLLPSHRACQNLLQLQSS